MYNTIQVRLNVSDAVMAFITHQCQHANSLTNCALFEIRQKHFESCERIEFFDKEGMFRSELKTKIVKSSYADICKTMTDNPHYKVLGGQCAQQALKSVNESFSSFNSLLKLFWKGELDDRPRIPNYRKKGGLAPISYPAQALKFDIETGECRIPISRELSEDIEEALKIDEIKLNGVFGIKPEQIVELRIIPRNSEFYVEYVYQEGNDGPTCNLGLTPKQALGIDPGVGNWLTCVSTLGKSFIVDGHKIKSINQNYNRRVSQIKKGKCRDALAGRLYWDLELAMITEKRNRLMRDAVNKAARFVINHAISNKIGIIVFGWNQGIKNESNMGKKNNQEFVQIPTARLKNRIKDLCEKVGIQFVETEESYTSKASFLDNDVIPVYGGAKPANWRPSGKREPRGLYRSALGWEINSDCNGAANIIRKVATQLGLDLAECVRAVLNLPKRYDIFSSLKKAYRKRCNGVLLAPVTTSV